MNVQIMLLWAIAVTVATLCIFVGILAYCTVKRVRYQDTNASWFQIKRKRKSKKKSTQAVALRVIENYREETADALKKLRAWQEEHPYSDYSDPEAQELLLQYIGALMAYNDIYPSLSNTRISIDPWLDRIEDWRYSGK